MKSKIIATIHCTIYATFLALTLVTALYLGIALHSLISKFLQLIG